MQVIVDSLATAYYRDGSSPRVLLCLHGWGDSSQTFQGLSRDLSRDFTVVRLDLPGFGGAQAPPVAWGLDDYAQFVADFLRKTKIQPSAIIGHSNGGAVAVRGLATGVLAADKLVLIATSGVRRSARQNARRRAWLAVTKTGKALTILLPDSAKRSLRRRLYAAAGSDQLVVPHMQETFRKVVSQDIQPDASKVAQPTLLVYGDRDADTPVAFAQTLAGLIKHSTLHVVEGAGHFVHHEQPDEVLGAVREFLA